MTHHPASVAPHSSAIQSFRVALDGWRRFQAEAQPVDWLETQLYTHLEPGSRLLRWAIVQSDGATDRFWCEGAYLLRPPPVSRVPSSH